MRTRALPLVPLLATLLSTLLALPVAAPAQHPGGTAAARPSRPPREATQYDFLVGQWELTVTPKVSGLAARIHGVPKLRGTWKAWRALDGWGIEDEVRVVDESGNPRSLMHNVRVYDATAHHWTLVAVDAYRQAVTQAAAQWQGGEMVGQGQGVDGEGKAYVSRSRIGRITPTSFRYQLDRSYDGGRTWTEGLTVMEAKRVSATAAR